MGLTQLKTPRQVHEITKSNPSLMLVYRDLFAIEYMQEHPKTTTTEFAAVFNNLNAASSAPSTRVTPAHFPLQKYNNASRACKQERLDA